MHHLWLDSKYRTTHFNDMLVVLAIPGPGPSPLFRALLLAIAIAIVAFASATPRPLPLPLPLTYESLPTTITDQVQKDTTASRGCQCQVPIPVRSITKRTSKLVGSVGNMQYDTLQPPSYFARGHVWWLIPILLSIRGHLIGDHSCHFGTKPYPNFRSRKMRRVVDIGLRILATWVVSFTD